MAIYRCEACGREGMGPPVPYCQGGEMTHRREPMRILRAVAPVAKKHPGRQPRL